MSPRPPPKISLRHDHDWTRGNDELGSTVEQQPVGKLVQQSFGEVQRVKLSKPTQPKPNPICDRSGQLDITLSVIRAQNNLSEDIRVEQTHDRSGQPDKHKVERQDAPEVHREITMLNTDNDLTREIIEEDIDFNIPGLPRSIVKQLHSASVSRIDSENREPSVPTCSSTRPTTESII